MYTYEPYRSLLEKKCIKQNELITKGVINRNNASSLKHNKPVTTETLEKLCQYFNCQFSDLVRHIQD